MRSRRGRDRMVAGFITTYAISTYHHWNCEFESRSGLGVQHYLIKFVSDLRQIGGFFWILRFPPPEKLYITEILLKVALNSIKQTNKHCDDLDKRLDDREFFKLVRIGVLKTSLLLIFFRNIALSSICVFLPFIKF
jgi:hypothetical protein